MGIYDFALKVVLRTIDVTQTQLVSATINPSVSIRFWTDTGLQKYKLARIGSSRVFTMFSVIMIAVSIPRTSPAC